MGSFVALPDDPAGFAAAKLVCTCKTALDRMKVS
jgi:hypothetical protein